MADEERVADEEKRSLARCLLALQHFNFAERNQMTAIKHFTASNCELAIPGLVG